MRCGSDRKIEHYFIDVTPAPPFRRIIGLDDPVPGRVKMFCSVPVWRLIAATDMATDAADPQMQPWAAPFQTFRALGTTSRIAERCLQNIAMFLPFAFSEHESLLRHAEAPRSALSCFPIRLRRLHFVAK